MPRRPIPDQPIPDRPRQNDELPARIADWYDFDPHKPDGDRPRLLELGDRDGQRPDRFGGGDFEFGDHRDGPRLEDSFRLEHHDWFL